MSVFKIHYQSISPLLVYCRLYVAPAPNQTYAGCGNFFVRAGEFEELRRVMAGVEFKDVTGKVSDKTT